MVTVKLPFAVLPCPSFAEQFTVVTPMGNELPEAGEQLGVTEPATRSLATRGVRDDLARRRIGLVRSMFAGRFRVGFRRVLDDHRERAVAKRCCRAPSVAVQVTDVEPSGNVEPDGCEPQPTVGATPLLSLALIVQVTVAPPGPVASVVAGGVARRSSGCRCRSRVTLNPADEAFRERRMPCRRLGWFQSRRDVPEPGTAVDADGLADTVDVDGAVTL